MLPAMLRILTQPPLGTGPFHEKLAEVSAEMTTAGLRGTSAKYFAAEGSNKSVAETAARANLITACSRGGGRASLVTGGWTRAGPVWFPGSSDLLFSSPGRPGFVVKKVPFGLNEMELLTVQLTYKRVAISFGGASKSEGASKRRIKPKWRDRMAGEEPC
jgi:hypothetical protein